MMSDTIEFELTFLLKQLPEGLEKCRNIEIRDFYIPASSEHPKIRIRGIGKIMEITKKEQSDEDFSESEEHTIKLDADEFDALTKLPSKKLFKTRYFFKHLGRECEIDIFHGALEGLALVDFEFKNRDELKRFKMPDFCLADVTQEKFIAGGMLCGKSYEEIESRLNRFGYKKILIPR